MMPDTVWLHVSKMPVETTFHAASAKQQGQFSAPYIRRDLYEDALERIKELEAVNGLRPAHR